MPVPLYPGYRRRFGAAVASTVIPETIIGEPEVDVERTAKGQELWRRRVGQIRRGVGEVQRTARVARAYSMDLLHKHHEGETPHWMIDTVMTHLAESRRASLRLLALREAATLAYGTAFPDEDPRLQP